MRAIIVVGNFGTIPIILARLFTARFARGWGNIIYLFLQKYIIGTVEEVLLFTVSLLAFLERVLAWFRCQISISTNLFFFSYYGLIQAAKYNWEYNLSNKHFSNIHAPEIHHLLPQKLVVVQSSSSVNSKCDAH